METIRIEPNYLVADQVAWIEGTLCIMVYCPDYDHFRQLPQVVSYQGTLCGKTGWNSDSGRAAYQSNAQVVKKVG